MFRLVLFSLVIIGINLYMIGEFSTEESLKFANISIIALGFLFGVHQLKANQDWNRRSTALLEMEKNNARYLEARRFLLYEVPEMKLEDRKEAYSPKEIHDLICEKDDEGNYAIKPETSNMYILTEKGVKIRAAIFAILNYYELIATGVNNSIMDENVVKNLEQHAMIRTWTLFNEYVKHYREKHSKGKHTLVQFEKLITRWGSGSLLNQILVYVNLKKRNNVED